MIFLDEPNKYKWTIKYQILENQSLTTIIEGKYYDFIPNKGDIIVLENNLYIVGIILYDFDENTILISLNKKEKGSDF